MNEVVGLIDSEMAQLKSDLDVWEQRWQAIHDNLTNLLNEIEDNSLPHGISRIQTIYCMLKNLQTFGKSHFHYFYQGFLNDRFQLRDKEKNKYPYAMILRSIIDQMAYDFQIITRALEQRQPFGNYTEIQDALDKADRLGQMALRPAIDDGLIGNDTTVLTYFQKSMTVRVIPYAKVAIIGIPFTALKVTRDYLAIPHEVAHYIYRHGRANSGLAISLTTERMFNGQDIPNYLRNWVEEIFADLYGCLVAGPVMAIDFQDLQLDDPWREFLDATIDEEDPVPVVRPDIYTKVLGHSKKDTKRYKLANLVEMRWNKLRDDYLERENDTESIAFRIGESDKDPIKLDDIRKKGRDFDQKDPLALDSIIQRILKQFFSKISATIAKKNQGYLEWSGDLSNINASGLEELYTNFRKTYLTIEKVDSLESLRRSIDSDPEKPVVYFPPCNEVSDQLDDVLQDEGVSVSKLWVDYVTAWATRRGYNPITNDNKIEELISIKRHPRTKDDSKQEVWGWVDLALAEGWVTRGPEPNPTGDKG